MVGHPEQPGEVGAGGNPLGGEGGDPEGREPTLISSSRDLGAFGPVSGGGGGKGFPY